MAWTSRNVSNFNSVANILETLFSEDERGVESGNFEAYGSYRINDHWYKYELIFCTARLSVDGYYIPAGSMSAMFFQD